MSFTLKKSDYNVLKSPTAMYIISDYCVRNLRPQCPQITTTVYNFESNIIVLSDN